MMSLRKATFVALVSGLLGLAIPASAMVCPDGQIPISVVNGGVYCAVGPVCVGSNANGNCPGPQEGIPHGSRCAIVSENVYGCIANDGSSQPTDVPPSSKPPTTSPPSGCTGNQVPVSVINGGVFCAELPICVATVTDGNCPGPQEGLPGGSECVKVADRVYGCKAKTGSIPPSEVPTVQPSPKPTSVPPSEMPTMPPSEMPTIKPSDSPTVAPDNCDAGQNRFPVSVIGATRIYCADGPICAGNSGGGNCPQQADGLEGGSSCVQVASGVYGCKKNNLVQDAPPSPPSPPPSPPSPPPSPPSPPPSPPSPPSPQSPPSPPPPPPSPPPSPPSPPPAPPGDIVVPDSYPPQSSVNTMTPAFAWTLVEQHNVIRAWHGLGPVTWNAEKAPAVQQYANSCPGFSHSSLGWENLATTGGKCDTIEACKKNNNPSWMWYHDEEALWSYANNRCTQSWSVCGHFSNMMSPSVKSIACGSSNCGGRGYVWCNYFTPVSNPVVPQKSGPKSDLCAQHGFSCGGNRWSSVNREDDAVSEAMAGETAPVSSTSVGAIVGVVAAVAAVGALITATVIYRKRSRKERVQNASTPMECSVTPASCTDVI